MNVANDSTEWVDDFAARWTDSALEILKTAGIKGSSVPMELEIWHSLQEVLQSVLRREQEFQLRPLSVDVFMEQALLRATLRVARKFEPGTTGLSLLRRIHPALQRQKTEISHYRLYLRIVRRRVLNGAARQPDYFSPMVMVGG